MSNSPRRKAIKRRRYWKRRFERAYRDQRQWRENAIEVRSDYPEPYVAFRLPLWLLGSSVMTKDNGDGTFTHTIQL